MAEKKIKDASAESSKTQEKPIRQSLVNNGVKNERIGWNDKTASVTIDGKDVYKPKTNIDGTTYADDSDIRDMTRKAYQLAGDDIVAARNYVTSKGYSGVVEWDGDNAVIGGEVIEPIYVQSGMSFIPRSQMDSAIANLEQRNGILGNDEIDRRYQRKYGNDIDNAISAILNREEFSYDPEEDVAYQAYRDQYTREAEEAFRRVLNDYNTSVTGASGAVLSEAMYMRDRALRELTDKIPELVGDAYDRYSDETQRMYDDLSVLYSMGSDYYDRLYSRDRDAREDISEAGAAERAENQRLTENERNRVNDYYDNMLTQTEIDRGNIDTALGNIDLRYYDGDRAAEYEGLILDNMLKESEYNRSLTEQDMADIDYAMMLLEYNAMRSMYGGW